MRHPASIVNGSNGRHELRLASTCLAAYRARRDRRDWVAMAQGAAADLDKGGTESTRHLSALAARSDGFPMMRTMGAMPGATGGSLKVERCTLNWPVARGPCSRAASARAGVQPNPLMQPTNAGWAGRRP